MIRTVHAQRHPAAAVIALATVLFLALSMAMPTAAFAEYNFGEDERFNLIDRSDDSRIAYAHSDHWHGSLPTVPLDDRLSLGAEVLDQAGDAIDLGGNPYSLGVAFADGADEGPLELVDHGDHVHLRGEAEGETDVVFMVMSGDSAVYTTPPIAVTVSADADHGHDDDHGHSHDDDDHGHSHDDDHDDAPEGGVDAGFGGAAGSSGLSLTTVLFAGTVLFALLALAVALRPARAEARR